MNHGALTMPHQRLFLLACSLFALFLGLQSPTILAAESTASETIDQPVIEEQIIVTADRTERPRDEAGSSVTVISAEQIEARRQPSVADLLRTVPGLEIARSGGYGQVTSAFLRGGSSSQTLVLIDGQRANSATTGAYDLADLQSLDIERLEVVRGPQSTVHGSEAMTGVIQLVTKKGGPGITWNALGEAGSDDLLRLRAGVAGSQGPFDYRLSASELEVDGVSAAQESRGNSEVDPWESSSQSARLGLDFSAQGRADLSLRRFASQVATDGFAFGVGPVDALDRLQDREALSARLRVQLSPSNRWTHSLSLGVVDERLIGSDPADFFSNFRVDSEVSSFSLQSDFEFNADGAFSLGLQSERRDGVSVGNFDQQVDIDSAFVEGRFTLGQQGHLTAGVRHDDHSEFGGETTYRLSATTAWPARDTRLRLSWGTGFKAPTFNDLFFPFFSNPDLVPETSSGWDIGLEKRFAGDRVTLDLTWFSLDFDDLIVFDQVAFRPENLASASSDGIELGLGLRPAPSWGIDLSYTWNDTEDEATGAPLPRRPKHRGTLQIDGRLGDHWRLSAVLSSVADRIDSNGSEIDDYSRLDLALGYRLSQRAEPYLRLENALDEDYEEIPGFTSPGVVGAVGVSLTF